LIFKSPGPNYLRDLVDFGPAFYVLKGPSDQSGSELGSPNEQISLPLFLDFAVGACECLELLHHRARTVHGELRGDAFHFNKSNGVVRLVNFGSGLRSFENGLTSVGWSSLSKEVGVKDKLRFIAPEQTGRMPAAPDSRTDIYSLGIIFWVMLVRESPFEGQTPMEIVQNVLSKRIPPVSSKRLDVPDCVSAIIQKMTSKQIDDRYHSASGLKYDLLRLQRILGNGDGEALKRFKIATRDVSSYFNLPGNMVGRQKERDKIVDIIVKVSKLYLNQRPSRDGPYSYSSSLSSLADSRIDSLELHDSGDETSSQSASVSRGNSEATLAVGAPIGAQDADSNQGSAPPGLLSHRGTRTPPVSTSSLEVSNGTTSSRHASEPVNPSRKRSVRYKATGQCEVIAIAGAAGLGKSCLVQSVQTLARRYGYLASAKFDTAKKQPFEPVLKVMSSLFRQIFSEGDVTTEFHRLVRAYVAPVSNLLHFMLDIPQDLLGEETLQTPKASPSATAQNPDAPPSYTDPALLNSSSAVYGAASSTQSTAGFLKAGSSAKSLRSSSTFLNILRLLARYKFICLCFDDLQFADEESLELLSSIIAAKIQLVVIVSSGGVTFCGRHNFSDKLALGYLPRKGDVGR
jgi:serine/threonine protein kinase